MTGNLIATFALDDAESEASATLQARLWATGCSGLWEKDPNELKEAGTVGDPARMVQRSGEPGLLDAFFVDDDWRPDLAGELSSLADQNDARFLGFELLLERDWMESHRQLARPRIVGDFLIDPREPDDSAHQPLEAGADEARWRLRVPARQAFGTGSHETTRLTLRALADLEVSGAVVIDVGCGSGVLSFAAHRLGAGRVLGYDVDPVAAFASRVNAGLNGMVLGRGLRFLAGSERMLRPGLADVLLVNVLPEKLEGAESTLCALLRSGGVVIVSGLLVADPLPSSTTSALERWGRLGWCATRTYEEGEWVAYRLETAASGLGRQR